MFWVQILHKILLYLQKALQLSGQLIPLTGISGNSDGFLRF